MAKHIHVHIHRAPTQDRAPIARAVRSISRDQHAAADVSQLVNVLMQIIAEKEGTGTRDAEFDESKHKRDSGGRFTAGGMNAEQHKAAAEHHSKVAKASKDPMEAIHNTDLATRHGRAAEKLSAAASLTGAHQEQALEDASYHAKHAEDFKKQFGIKGLEVSSRSASQGEKPTKATASGAKAATHELLSSGHPFSVDELCKATGASKASVMTALSDLKNPKYAGKLGALEIVKRSDGMYHVQKKEGAGLAPKPGPDGQPMGKHPELAAAERRVAENPRTTGSQSQQSMADIRREVAQSLERGMAARQPGGPASEKKSSPVNLDISASHAKLNAKGVNTEHVKYSPLSQQREMLAGLADKHGISPAYHEGGAGGNQAAAVRTLTAFNPGAMEGLKTGKHPELANAERRVAENPSTTSAAPTGDHPDPLMHAAVSATAKNFGGSPLTDEQVDRATRYMAGKRNVDVLKMSDALGMSVGAALHLNDARKDYFRSEGPRGPQTQAERINNYLKQKHIGLIKRGK